MTWAIPVFYGYPSCPVLPKASANRLHQSVARRHEHGHHKRIESLDYIASLAAYTCGEPAVHEGFWGSLICLRTRWR